MSGLLRRIVEQGAGAVQPAIRPVASMRHVEPLELSVDAASLSTGSRDATTEAPATDGPRTSVAGELAPQRASSARALASARSIPTPLVDPADPRSGSAPDEGLARMPGEAETNAVRRAPTSVAERSGAGGPGSFEEEDARIAQVFEHQRLVPARDAGDRAVIAPPGISDPGPDGNAWSSTGPEPGEGALREDRPAAQGPVAPGEPDPLPMRAPQPVGLERLLGRSHAAAERVGASAAALGRSGDRTFQARESTELHVTIGSIEVTAVHAAAPAEKPKPERRGPMPLEEYLARREGRRA